MTSLAAAIARDSRGPTSLYLLTDSRITWVKSTERWDAGRKTFVSPGSADVFGYCGDAYFMPMALNQVLNLIACGVMDLTAATAEERHTTMLDQLKNTLGRISTKHVLDMTLFHGAREGEGMKCTFRLWRSVYKPKLKRWYDEELSIEDRSYLASVDGTGKPTVEKFEVRTSETAASGTSRAAINAFCRSLESGADPFSGGPPQLVGLWRIGIARQFGFCWKRSFYIAGMEYPLTVGREKIAWFNELFEHCDPLTGRRREGSPSHKSSLQT
jgi:hypothetical protein